ncbi:hypothetical protein ACWEFJ_23505 [Actinosynnema sp. NPDC004786]
MDFDVVLGIDSASFSAGVDKLNKDPKTHAAFFKGDYRNDTVSGTWEVEGKSPAFEFRPPDPARWRQSVNAKGEHPTGDPPTGNVFVLAIPKLRLVFTIDGAQADLAPGVEFYGQAALADGTLSITPLSIWADPSTMSTAEKAIVNGLILPKVYDKLGPVLSGHKVPPQTITIGDLGFTLTVVEVLITGGRLVIVTTGDTSTAVPLPGEWPAKPVFAVVNRAYAQRLATEVARANRNKTLYDGTEKNDRAKLTVHAVLASVDDIAIDKDDATVWSGALDVAFDAVASYLGIPCAFKKSSDSL